MPPLFGRRRDDETLGITPNPRTIGLRHIDMELARFAAGERTPLALAAIDALLDRRLGLKPARPATVPVVPGGEGGS